MLTVLSLDHTRSAVAEREPFALGAAEQTRMARVARRANGVQIAFLLTCNRVELILWSDHAEPRDAIADFLSIGRRLLPGIAERFIAAATRHHGQAAAEHLLRVAAGIESQVEGDVQVLGQLRAAYAWAAESGSLGAQLHRIFQTALRAGKRVHHETEFGRRKASLGTAAAATVVARLPAALAGRASVVLLGAGKAAELAARALVERGVDLTIINRDRQRAEVLAGTFGGRVAAFDARHAAVATADAAILATGASGPVLAAAELQGERDADPRGAAPLLLIDLAFPRNVEAAVADIQGVTLLGLQDLDAPGMAEAEREAALRIIDEEAETLRLWFDARSARRLGAA